MTDEKTDEIKEVTAYEVHGAGFSTYEEASEHKRVVEVTRWTIRNNVASRDEPFKLERALVRRGREIVHLMDPPKQPSWPSMDGDLTERLRALAEHQSVLVEVLGMPKEFGEKCRELLVEAASMLGACKETVVPCAISGAYLEEERKKLLDLARFLDTDNWKLYGDNDD